MTRHAHPTTIALAAVCACCIAKPASADGTHSDVDFTYANGQIDVEFGDEGRVFEADLPIADDTSADLIEQFTDDPGFATSGLTVANGNTIDFNVLGPLRYHDGSGFDDLPTGANLQIADNGTNAGVIAIDGSTTGPVSGSGVIAEIGPSGSIDAHIDLFLDPQTLGPDAYGAYGLLMELTTDASGIANSESFYIVFNFGLAEGEGNAFEGAVEDFAAAVPEPASAGLLLAGLGLLGRRRRRA